MPSICWLTIGILVVLAILVWGGVRLAHRIKDALGALDPRNWR